MKTFNHSELQDFLEDNSFRLWVLGKSSSEQAQEWEQFPLRYPEHASTFKKAQKTLIAIQGDTFVLPVSKVRQNIKQILESTEVPAPKPLLPWYQTNEWRWVAAVVFLFAIYWFSWQMNRETEDLSSRVYQQMVDKTEVPLEEITNTSSSNRLITLSDGSTVVLQPNSRISYPKQFHQHANREIYLTGEAYFEVAKNPEKPFLVYADNLITKVLGTSFTVKATEKAQVIVTVKTGKVSVFTRFDKENIDKKKSRQLMGLVLTANQQVQFDQEKNQLFRTLVESPTLVDLPIHQTLFEFNNTPVTNVFASLESAYGIEIVFDAEVMKNCYLTASLDDEPLFEKLNMICQTLDAQYEQMDGKILVSSKGCP